MLAQTPRPLAESIATTSVMAPATSPRSPLQSRRSVSSPAQWPVAVLALTLFLTPAVGVPNELMLQDTLKSAVVSFGVLLAALVFFWQQRHRTEPLLWHSMVWLPVVLMLYALGSMVWSHTYLAGVEAIRWFILSLLMWLGLNTLTRQNLPLLLWGIHGGAVVASLWAAAQFWFDLSLFPQAAAPSSTFVNRNFFAEYAVSVLPLSIYLLANLRPSRWLLAMALSVAFNTVALLMTGTRSALLALLVLLPAMLFILARYRSSLTLCTWPRRWQAGVGLVLITAVLAMGTLPSASPLIVQAKIGNTALERSFLRAASMTESKEYTERSFSTRAQMWLATARMIQDKPWTGVGAGAWEVQIPLHQRKYTVLETDYYAHNEYLQLLSEYGVLVGGLTLAFLLAYLLQSATTAHRLKSQYLSEAPTRAVILSCLLALSIVSAAGFALHLASCGALLALSLGALAASDARLAKPAVRALNKSSKLRWTLRAMPGAIVGCLMLASYITQQAVMAEANIVHALELSAQATRFRTSDPKASEAAKVLAVQSVRAGIAINPHYRRLTALVAEMLSARGDWNNAVWILETLVESRPQVAALWSGLANGYSQLGQHSAAIDALQQVKRLKPDALDSAALEVSVLSRSGRDDQASALLTRHFDQRNYSFDMLQM
ncbi:MAG: O-antigen ligase family protein, partial [Rhodoferax sp.]|nr:O-antigen ligase family protein [Rhodoferax sp.]